MTGLPKAVSPTYGDHIVGSAYLREALANPLDVPPVLMLHGRCHGWWAYAQWLFYFATMGWPSFAMSLRGHPRARALRRSELLATTFDDYLADLNDVLDWLGRPAFVIGHSLGGILAQKAAEDRQLAGLILLASVGPSQLGRHAPDFALDQPVDDRPEYRSKGKPEIARRLVPESPLALNAVRGRMPIRRDRIDCPVLVVGGELDDTGVHRPEELAAFYDCPYVIVPRATHDLMFDATSRTTAGVIESWLLGLVGVHLIAPG